MLKGTCWQKNRNEKERGETEGGRESYICPSCQLWRTLFWSIHSKQAFGVRVCVVYWKCSPTSVWGILPHLLYDCLVLGTIHISTPKSLGNRLPLQSSPWSMAANSRAQAKRRRDAHSQPFAPKLWGLKIQVIIF